MAALVRFVIPYKSLSFLKSYFDAIRIVDAFKQRQVVTDEECLQYRSMQKWLGFSHLVILVKLVHFAILWTLTSESSLDTFHAAINADLIGMARLDRTIQLLLLFFFGLMHFYFGRMLFVTYHPFFLSHFYRVAFEGDLSCMFISPFKYQNKPIQTRVRQNTFYALNVVQIFPIGLHMIGVFLQYKGLATIWSNWNQLSEWIWPLLATSMSHLAATLLAVIYFEVCFTLIMLLGYDLVLIGTIGLSAVTLALTTGFIMFGQIVERCQVLAVSRRVSHCLVATLHHSRRSIIIVLKLTSYYSNQMGVFMLVNVPFNGYLLGILISGDLGPEWIPIMVIFMVQQWVGIFGLHIVGIRFNEAMRRPNKYLLPMPARRKLPLRISLLMARYLEAFHTKKRYGIGYGVLGIISMANFLKSILIYGEFVMYAYKMMVVDKKTS